MIIVNCKTYKEGSGKRAVLLAKICNQVSKQTGVQIALALQAADMFRVAQAVSIPVFAQHVDSIDSGAHTGWISAETLQEAHAEGSLINHSEHALSLQIIKKTIEKLKSLKLVSIVCVKTPRDAQVIAKLKPDMIAIEPAQLIGGKISIAQAQPTLIAESLRRTKGIPLLCGAGIHTKEDVQVARMLGASGVLVSSGVVLAKNPRKVLENLAAGFF